MTVNLPKEIAWLGPLPPDYTIVRLGFLASQVNDKNIGMRSKNLLSLSYGNIKKRDIQSADGLLPESFETYNCIKKDDIVLRMTDLQNDKRSLRSAISTQDGIITSAYISLRCKKIYPKFLAYYLRCLDNAKVFYSMGSGLRQSLTWDDIRKLPVAVPPLDKQKRIADELDRELAEIDNFIADQYRLLNLIDEKFQIQLEHIFSENCNYWIPLKRLGVTKKSGFSANGAERAADINSEIGVLKTGSVTKGEFLPRENKLVDNPVEINKLQTFVEKDSLIVNRANTKDLVGSIGYAEKSYQNLFLSDLLWLITVEGTDPRIIYYYSMTQSYRKQIAAIHTGTSETMQKIAYENFRNILIPKVKNTSQVTLINDIAEMHEQKNKIFDEFHSLHKLLNIRKDSSLVEKIGID